MRACLRKGWLSSRAAARDLAAGHRHLDALVAQDAEAAARGLLVGSSDATTTRAMPASHDRVGAGRGAAVVGAGLERHVHASRPAGSSVQAASASRSAWGSPAAAWKPSPIDRPSLTTTAPTSGFGLVRPRGPRGELDRPPAGALVALGGRVGMARGCWGPRGSRPTNAWQPSGVTAPWPSLSGRPRCPSRSGVARRARAHRRSPASWLRLAQQRLRAALRLQRRRGLALHQPRGGDVRRRRQPGLLPEPLGLHIPGPRGAATALRALAVGRAGAEQFSDGPLGDLR